MKMSCQGAWLHERREEGFVDKEKGGEKNKGAICLMDRYANFQKKHVHRTGR